MCPMSMGFDGHVHSHCTSSNVHSNKYKDRGERPRRVQSVRIQISLDSTDDQAQGLVRELIACNVFHRVEQ